MNNSPTKEEKAPIEVTTEEAFYVAWMRYLRETPRTEYRREWRMFGLRIVFSWRSKKNIMGRFGGGWNWKLGFMAGGSTVIISLLIADVRMEKAK